MRKEDQDWVSEQIRVATQRPEARRIKKLLWWLREWTILGPLIAVTVAVALFIGNSITRDSEFRGRTDQRLTTIEQKSGSVDQRLSNIEASILSLRVHMAAANPGDTKSQAEAVDVLTNAHSRSIPLPLDVIEQTGQRFIQVANQEPSAWNVGLQFLNYRSFLNTSLVSVPSNLTPSPESQQGGYRFSVTIAAQPPGSKGQLFFVRQSGTAPPADSALMDSLSSPPPPGTGSGAQFLVVDAVPGVGLSLDNMRMKNVIIRNAIIFYSGKPVILDHVAFINCTFQIQRSPVGTRLGGELLAESNLVFKSPA
jgi:hypothetical protein